MKTRLIIMLYSGTLDPTNANLVPLKLWPRLVGLYFGYRQFYIFLRIIKSDIADFIQIIEFFSPKKRKGRLDQTRRPLINECPNNYVCIDARNSAFVLVLPRRSNTTSICSTGESGLSTRRMTQIRLRSSLLIRSSSLRVPDRCRSIAGKRRLSERRRSR